MAHVRNVLWFSVVLIGARFSAFAQDAEPAAAEAPAPPRDVASIRNGTSYADQVGRFPDQAVVTSGTFARSFHIPTTGLSLRIGGLAQLTGRYDTALIASGDIFSARSIQRDRRNAAFLGASDSRLNVDVRGDFAGHAFRVFIEGDFGGDGGSQLSNNATTFRLFHAFGQYGNLYAGQWWSAMADVAAFPETLDVFLPSGKSSLRQAGVKYKQPLGQHVELIAGIENPETDARAGNGSPVIGYDEIPDVVGAARAFGDWGHVRAAGVLRRLSSRTGGDAHAWGYGTTVTGRINMPWRDVRENVVFQGMFGNGIGRYISELATGGYGATLNAGELHPVTAYSGYVGYQHWWTSTIRSTATAGFARINHTLTGDPYRASQSFASNLVWNPFPAITIGAEVAYGRRQINNAKGPDAFRGTAIARFGF